MLRIVDLKKVYKPKKGKAVTALNGINLEISDKGMVFLLGKSGSGKSTLLNLIGGLDSYTSGDIIIKGKSTRDFVQSNFDSYRNTFIGFIFQEFYILEEYSVGQNIALALELQHKKGDRAEVEKILAEVDLEGYYDRKPNELSGGQKQRVAIARALVKKPEIIMADEPTGALDSNTGKQVFDTLKRLSENKLVIVVTHDRENAEIYGDRIIELADGDVIVDRIRSKVSGEFVDNDVSVVDEKLIRIKAGKKLTVSDLEVINKMLEKTTDDAFLSLDSNSNAKFSQIAERKGKGQGKFEKTSSENNHIKKYDAKDFKLLKSRLPFKDSLKMGANGIKGKPIRLFFTVLLTVIAVMLFGFSSVASEIDINKTEFQTLRQHNIKGTTISSVAGWKGIFGVSYDEYYSKGLTSEQVADIEKITGLPSFELLNRASKYNAGISLDQNLNKMAYDAPLYYKRYINSFLVVPDVPNKEEYLGVQRLAGRMPEKGNEIAISDYIADTFLTYGYKESTDYSGGDTGIEIKSVDELIGKTLSSGMVTIVGVYKTDIDKNIKIIQDKRTNKENIFSYLLFDVENHMMGMGLVTDEYASYMSGVASSTLYEWNNDRKLFTLPSSSYENSDSIDTVDILKAIDKMSSVGENDVYFGEGNPAITTLADNQIIIDGTLLMPGDMHSEYELKTAFDNLTSAEKSIYIACDDGRNAFNKDYYNKYEIVGIWLGTGKTDIFSGAIVSDTLYYGFASTDIYTKYIDVVQYSGSWLDVKEDNEFLTRNAVDYYYKAATWNFSNVYMANGKNPNNLADDEIIVSKNMFIKPTDEMENIDELIKTRFDSAVMQGKNTVLWGSQDWIDEEQEYRVVSGLELKIVGVELNEYSSSVYCSDEFYSSMYAMVNAPKSRYFRLSGDVNDYVALQRYIDKTLVVDGDFYQKLMPQTLITGFTQGFVNIIMQPVRMIFLWLVAFFSVFAVLMMINFIAVSIVHKKKEIGVLRAIGARSADVFKIFFSEGAIIALVNLILSIIAVQIVCSIFNNMATIAIFVMGVYPILSMAFLCFLTALVATYIPVRKIARKKPIDAINNR